MKYVTDSGRVILTHLDSVDEIVEFWRTKYDAIFAQEARSRRLWAATARSKTVNASGVVEQQILNRQAEWDAYVRDRLIDLATAKPAVGK